MAGILSRFESKKKLLDSDTENTIQEFIQFNHHSASDDCGPTQHPLYIQLSHSKHFHERYFYITINDKACVAQNVVSHKTIVRQLDGDLWFYLA